jgi:hypothetical protein
MHGIHVHLSEERGRYSNDRRDRYLTGLPELTYVASFDIPSDISADKRATSIALLGGHA